MTNSNSITNFTSTQQFGEERDINKDYSVILFFSDGREEVTPENENVFAFMERMGYSYNPVVVSKNYVAPIGVS